MQLVVSKDGLFEQAVFFMSVAVDVLLLFQNIFVFCFVCSYEVFFL